MLTRQQLQRIAQREHIGLQAQERDYLQHLLLSLVYARTQALLFKGGTALRIAYRGGRYSEDLDFNAALPVADLQPLWAEVVADLERYGILAETRDVWRSAEGYSFDVSYRGPLYDGRDRTKGKVRVDLSLRGEVVDTVRELISPEYDDVRPFVVTVLTPEHMVAEKIRALLVRGKPRDAYDLWLMRAKRWRVDWTLVERKLSIYDLRYSPERLEAALADVAEDWGRDLRALLAQPVAFDDVRRAVTAYLQEP
jgi:predicted nucleotidyltransferase component of viral defense system